MFQLKLELILGCFSSRSICWWMNICQQTCGCHSNVLITIKESLIGAFIKFRKDPKDSIDVFTSAPNNCTAVSHNLHSIFILKTVPSGENFTLDFYSRFYLVKILSRLTWNLTVWLKLTWTFLLLWAPKMLELLKHKPGITQSQAPFLSGLFLFCFWNTVSLYIFGWPGAWSIDQAVFN